MEFGDWIPSLYPVLSIERESPGWCSGWTRERRSYKWGEDLRMGAQQGPLGKHRRYCWRGRQKMAMERLGHSVQRGSYLLLGFKQEVTRYNFCFRKISSALFWGWTEGHNSICKFSCSSLRPPCACLCFIFREALATRSHSILFIYLLAHCLLS